MKNILVIGASSGIGKHTAELLATQGNKVWGTYYSKPIENQDLFEHIEYLDVTKDFELNLPDQLDGLVFCPGAINLKPFKRLTQEMIYEDWNLQVNGAVRSIQKVLPNLSKSELGSVVLFSSVAVQSGFNFHASVAMSKGAIEGLTRSLAAEFAPKIRFNCIAPSLTDTPLSENLLNTDVKLAANAERHPMKRIGSPKDIAELACFMLSDKSSWITGQIMHVDGGIGHLK